MGMSMENMPSETPDMSAPSAGQGMQMGEGGTPKHKMSMLVPILVAAVIVLAGLGGAWWLMKSSKKAEPTANRVVKIGFIAPLTGDAANYGQVMQHGMELAQQSFNQEGLSFQILVRDTACDGAKAAAATADLVKAGVVAIIGETCSGATLKAVPVADQAKVVLLSPSASSPALSVEGDYFFRTYPTDSHQGIFTSELMYKKNVKKLAILHDTEAYGQGLHDVVVENYKKLGGSVAVDESFAAGETNFQAKLQKVADAKPDALYIVTNAVSTGAAIVSVAKQMNLNIPLYGGDALKDATFISDVGSAGDGMTLVTVTPGNRSFLDEYKATYGAEPANATGAQSYDAFMALAQVIKNGAKTGEDIKNALPAVEFQGKSGLIKFDKYGDLAGGGYLVYTVKDKQFVQSQ
jgi:branched-chain amino acid transport system substrate-binding protein